MDEHHSAAADSDADTNRDADSRNIDISFSVAVRDIRFSNLYRIAEMITTERRVPRAHLY